MFRKTMMALFAVASIGILAPDVALAFGGGHGGGGGGHGGGFGGHGGGGGGFGGGFSGGHGGVGVGAFHSGGFGGSFARSTAIGAAGVGAAGVGVAGVQGGRFAGMGFHHGGFHHGFHHGRRFFVGGFVGPVFYDDYYGYPYYVADDSYYDDSGCYIVRRRVHTRYGWRIQPVQVCG